MSFSFYIMVAYGRNNPKSNEAGIKYILIGAFSSAILLYGVSLLYGAVGVTRYDEIAAALTTAMANADSFSPTLWIGLALVLVGLGFKVAAVPFHMWAPDTYEGAPLPVTAFLSVGSKVAAFALLLRLFGEAFMPTIDQWQLLVAVLAAITMILGNVVAIAQRNMKRLLAYSSVGHVGFMLLGIAASVAHRRGVADSVHGRLRCDQHGRVHGFDCLLQRHRTGRRGRPGRAGGQPSLPCRGDGHRIVLPSPACPSSRDSLSSSTCLPPRPRRGCCGSPVSPC